MLSDHYKDKYGDWAGNPAGRKPNLDLCCEEISTRIGGWSKFQQCARKRGYGPDGAYCKQHDPEAVETRRREVRERGEAAFRKRVLEAGGPRFYAALKQIADGDNDPRTLAQEVIAPYRKEPSHD